MPKYTSHYRRGEPHRCLPFLLALMVSGAAPAAELYVDPELATACDRYNAAMRSCGDGTSQAFPRFDDAQSFAGPGDTLLLRGGSFGPLEILVSGAPGQPVAIRGYPGERVSITGPRSVAIRVVDQHHVSIADLDVRNVIGFGRLENATGITIDNVTFSGARASGTTGALKFVRSHHNRVTNSSFDDGSDLLLLQDDSDFNVLQDNMFHRASHSQISVRCSSYNIVRSSTFDNPKQKSVEIYDCEGVSDAPVRLDDTRQNLLERNRFLGTAGASRDYYFNAIQHGGQQNIVRYNVFTANRGGGVNYQYYAKESLAVYGNRLYNNTFYRNRCFAVIGQDGPRSRFFDNRVLNNLFFDNRDCSGRDGQTRITNRRSVILLNNGDARENPHFVDPDNVDLRLAPGSPWIDQGGFATIAVKSGSGQELAVEDASWFYDGYGIEHERGDIVRIEGRPGMARVVDIDRAGNRLLLDAPLQWQRGDGVHVLFHGAAPDMGAFETPARSQTSQ